MEMITRTEGVSIEVDGVVGVEEKVDCVGEVLGDHAPFSDKDAFCH